MNTTLRKPESVSSVNITPLAPRSLRTMCCTPTEMATWAWSKPWCTRYAMARSLNRLAYTSCMDLSTWSRPRTFRKVSCCPANEALGRSSAVAEDRTATAMSWPPAMASQAAAISCCRRGWNGVSRIQRRICVPHWASFFTSSTSSPSSKPAMRPARSPCARKSR